MNYVFVSFIIVVIVVYFIKNTIFIIELFETKTNNIKLIVKEDYTVFSLLFKYFITNKLKSIGYSSNTITPYGVKRYMDILDKVNSNDAQLGIVQLEVLNRKLDSYSNLRYVIKLFEVPLKIICPVELTIKTVYDLYKSKLTINIGKPNETRHIIAKKLFNYLSIENNRDVIFNYDEYNEKSSQTLYNNYTKTFDIIVLDLVDPNPFVNALFDKTPSLIVSIEFSTESYNPSRNCAGDCLLSFYTRYPFLNNFKLRIDDYLYFYPTMIRPYLTHNKSNITTLSSNIVLISNKYTSDIFIKDLVGIFINNQQLLYKVFNNFNYMSIYNRILVTIPIEYHRGALEVYKNANLITNFDKAHCVNYNSKGKCDTYTPSVYDKLKEIVNFYTPDN
jgi:TRAP-type uncharacterized transport system substrate-binding protein